MAEHGAFRRYQENLRRGIAREADPEKRRLLELQKGIEAAEYMAITSERMAGITRVIAGRNDSSGAIVDDARAEAFTKEARELREERESLIRVRLERETGTRQNEQGRGLSERSAGAQRGEADDGRSQPGRAAAGQQTADGTALNDQTAAASTQRRQDGPPAPGAYDKMRNRGGEVEAGSDQQPQSPNQPTAAKAPDPADKAGNVEMTDRRAAALAKIRERHQENAERDAHREQNRQMGRSPGRSR
jgi:hypothetical protein